MEDWEKRFFVYSCLRGGEQKDDIQSYIATLRESPRLIMIERGILPELMDGDHAVLFQALEFQINAELDWFERRYLARGDLAPELISTPQKTLYRPSADHHFAVLRIAQEVFDRDPTGYAHKIYLSAEHWWFSCTLSTSHARLYQSGLLGSVANWSKDSAYKFTTALSDAIINETPHLNLAEYIELQQTPFGAAESLLLAYARKIAEIPDEYDFRSELGRQLAAIKRAARQLHRSKNIQIPTLNSSGKMQLSGSGKRGKSKKSKGFVK